MVADVEADHAQIHRLGSRETGERDLVRVHSRSHREIGAKCNKVAARRGLSIELHVDIAGAVVAHFKFEIVESRQIETAAAAVRRFANAIEVVGHRDRGSGRTGFHKVQFTCDGVVERRGVGPETLRPLLDISRPVPGVGALGDCAVASDETLSASTADKNQNLRCRLIRTLRLKEPKSKTVDRHSDRIFQQKAC